jgi:hypothetical protein
VHLKSLFEIAFLILFSLTECKSGHYGPNCAQSVNVPMELTVTLSMGAALARRRKWVQPVRKTGWMTSVTKQQQLFRCWIEFCWSSPTVYHLNSGREMYLTIFRPALPVMKWNTGCLKFITSLPKPHSLACPSQLPFAK